MHNDIKIAENDVEMAELQVREVDNSIEKNNANILLSRKQIKNTTAECNVQRSVIRDADAALRECQQRLYTLNFYFNNDVNVRKFNNDIKKLNEKIKSMEENKPKNKDAFLNNWKGGLVTLKKKYDAWVRNNGDIVTIKVYDTYNNSRLELESKISDLENYDNRLQVVRDELERKKMELSYYEKTYIYDDNNLIETKQRCTDAEKALQSEHDKLQQLIDKQKSYANYDESLKRKLSDARTHAIALLESRMSRLVILNGEVGEKNRRTDFINNPNLNGLGSPHFRRIYHHHKKNKKLPKMLKQLIIKYKY